MDKAPEYAARPITNNAVRALVVYTQPGTLASSVRSLLSAHGFVAVTLDLSAGGRAVADIASTTLAALLGVAQLIAFVVECVDLAAPDFEPRAVPETARVSLGQLQEMDMRSILLVQATADRPVGAQSPALVGRRYVIACDSHELGWVVPFVLELRRFV